jgi:hypothetical protein
MVNAPSIRQCGCLRNARGWGFRAGAVGYTAGDAHKSVIDDDT